MTAHHEQEIEILLAEDGSEMKVVAHNFQGKGCEALVRAFQSGTVTASGPTADFFKQQTQKTRVRQSQ